MSPSRAPSGRSRVHTIVRCRIMPSRFATWVVWSFVVGASCAEPPDPGDPGESPGSGDSGASSDDTVARRATGEPAPRGRLDPIGATTADTPIGIALDVEDGAATPLRIRSQQRFYIQQIDLRAHVDRGVEEGVAGLAGAGDFAALDWTGTRRGDESFVSMPNTDGTFPRRRMFREARW